jgi:hypothetical protein
MHRLNRSGPSAQFIILGSSKYKYGLPAAPQLFWKMQMHARLASETTRSTSAHHSQRSPPAQAAPITLSPVLGPAIVPDGQSIRIDSPPLIPLACFRRPRPDRGVVYNPVQLALTESQSRFRPPFALLSGLGRRLGPLDLSGRKRRLGASLARWLKCRQGFQHDCISLA